MSGPRTGVAPTLFALLLRFYPRSFRARFGAAMCETFAEEMREARTRGRRALAALWTRAALRMPLLGLEEHIRCGVDRLRRDRTRRVPRVSAMRNVDSLTQDVRFAVRGLVRAPGFTVVTVLTLSLGVGATTALFSLTNALLWRPLPVAAPEELVSIQEHRTGRSSTGFEGVALPYARYLAYEEATRGVFSGLAAQHFREFSIRVDGPAMPVEGVVTSGNFFDVLGVRPAAGRFYERDDEAVIVLGHRLWQQHFGGSLDVLGHPVYVNGQVMTVVGVAARDFGGTVGFIFADLWVPYRAYAAAGWADTWLTPFGRLRPGVERTLAESVVNAAALRIPPDETGTEVHGARLEVMRGMPAVIVRAVSGFLGMLLATALLVLLIASANIAGMLLARAATRRREVAVRLALGAGRGRLVRQLLTETLVLFMFAGAAGILVAAVATRLLSRLRLPIFEAMLIDASPDGRVLAFALGIAAVTGTLFGLLPALQASRPALVPALKDGGRTGSVRGGRARSSFVAAQIAMSVLLLIVAALFVRTLQQATTADPGFSPEGVVVGTTELARHGYDEERGRAFYARLIERVRALPGVEAAALAQVALLTGDSEGHSGWRTAPDAPSTYAALNTVDASYFETMRIRLVAGRGIDETDVAGGARVIVINQTFAQRLWPGEDPIGREVVHDDRQYEVIGVTRDGKYTMFSEQPIAFAFLSAAQRYTSKQVLHVRTRAGVQPANMIAAVRAEVAALDPNVALERAMPLPTAVGFSLLPQRFAASLIGVFGLLGLVLAAIGVYGVLAHHVAWRAREFGIRVALGADARNLLTLVLGRGAALAAIGTAVGLISAAALTRFLQGFLYGIGPLDPVAFSSVPAVLGLVALLASYLPARRALRVDPMESLRQE